MGKLCHYGPGEPPLSPHSRHRPPLVKSLGQHHLRDGRATRPLVEFLAPAGATVIEIGPGGGVLTRELLAAGAERVLAVELDPAWAFALRRELVAPRLAVAVADALDLAWEELRAPALVAGNLPYNVGTAILERLLAGARRVPRAAFLLQREVVDRLVAGPGEPDYGALSVLVAARARARLLGRVPAGAFRPPPRVESAFVGLELGAPAVAPEKFAAFARVVRLAFAQRRKTLRNALASGWGRESAGRVLDALGLPEGTRAERLDLGAFLDLAAAAEAAAAEPRVLGFKSRMDSEIP